MTRDERKKKLEDQQNKLWCDHKTLLQIAEYYEKKADEYLKRHDEVSNELEAIFEETWAELQEEKIRNERLWKDRQVAIIISATF